MPELPEVETMCRAILPALGSTIVRVSRPRSKFRSIDLYPAWPKMKSDLEGCQISKIHRLGKRVAIELDSGSTLILQPKMAGIVLAGTPPTQDHVRMSFHLEGGPLAEFLYWDRRGLGAIHLYSEVELQARLGTDHLGPDACDVTFEQFWRRFQSKISEVKVALMDQRCIAGIGNMYASEILFRARIHPSRRCHQIERLEWRRIYNAMLAILTEAIALEGSTLSDGTYLKSLDHSGQYQSRLKVYDREGNVCGRCHRGVIERYRQAQRSTFFCPCCQIL